MSDLISRDAILKKIEKIRQSVQMMDDTHRADIIMTGMHLCEEAVRDQPSAQAGAIQCGECKHRYTEGINVVYNVCDLNHNKVQPDDWFCADAERRTDDTISD